VQEVEVECVGVFDRVKVHCGLLLYMVVQFAVTVPVAEEAGSLII
jgi:hypothetical protein